MRHSANLTVRVGNHQDATLLKLIEKLLAPLQAALNLEDDKVRDDAVRIKFFALWLRIVSWRDPRPSCW